MSWLALSDGTSIPLSTNWAAISMAPRPTIHMVWKDGMTRCGRGTLGAEISADHGWKQAGHLCGRCFHQKRGLLLRRELERKRARQPLLDSPDELHLADISGHLEAALAGELAATDLTWRRSVENALTALQVWRSRHPGKTSATGADVAAMLVDVQVQARADGEAAYRRRRELGQ